VPPYIAERCHVVVGVGVGVVGALVAGGVGVGVGFDVADGGGMEA
jgi:hypothetical protein